MRKKYMIVLICVFFVGTLLRAQIKVPKVDVNSTRAISYDRGLFFVTPYVWSPGYTTNCEQNNCPSMIYSKSFWFGGLDENDTLRLSVNSFSSNSFSPGPYSSNHSYETHAYSEKFFPSAWVVSKAEIIYHIDNYTHPQYRIPESILKWPANGDVSLGVANDLAPFVDVDYDGVYNPMNGDYPCIKGDMASYIIFNDHKEVSNSVGTSMGLEIHAMIYQFQSNNFLDSTTFLELRVINRGGHAYTDFKSAMFTYFQLGSASDDYMSVFPDKNTLFVMNGDNFDESWFSFPGFMENPPAAGILSLNKQLIHGARFGVGGGVGGQPYWPIHFPINADQYWSYLNGTWIDGSSFVQGSGYAFIQDSNYLSTNFAFGNNPYFNQGGNVPNDFTPRGYVGFETTSLLPGQECKIDLAIIMNRQGDYIENMHGLYNYTDSAQAFYHAVLTNYNCLQEGTGILDDFTLPFDWTPWMVEVKRLDGRGNMGFSIDLTGHSFGQVLSNNVVELLEYKANKSPVYVKIENPGAHALGRFELKFRDYASSNEGIDTASWTIYRYALNSTVLIDSVNSESTIIIGDLQYIADWGISVQVRQQNYFFSSGILPISQNLTTKPIEVTNHFDTDTIGWLTGVKDSHSLNPENWILSGYNHFVNTEENSCYAVSQKDGEGYWTGLLDGTIGHFSLLRSCDPMAPIGENDNLNLNSTRTRAVIAQTPSVDLVFTHEKEKWTRCVVVEMCDDATISQGNAQKMKPRNRPSVDKNGLSAGHPDYNAAEGDLISPVGMGWFPGFAIDVETRRRLNVVFGENSFFGNQNGSDMLWNPTSQMYDQVGNPRFGGQHVVFVIGENINNSGMPIYDSCAKFFNNINSTNNSLNRDAWQSATWTMYPILREGHQLLEKPVLIRMRVNKRYEDRVITGINNGKPAFEWNISSLLPADLSTENHDMPDALIYPNPSQSHFFVQFQNIQPDVIRVYAMTGVLVHEQAVSGGENVVRVETGKLASGVYVVQVGAVIRRVIID